MVGPDISLVPFIGFLFIVHTYQVLSTQTLPDEQDLLNRLFNDQSYDNSVRPVFNSSQNVVVHFGFTLIQVMDMVEKDQVLVTNAWLEHQWVDQRIFWDKNDYNGLEVIRLPAKKLWLPDIVLYNNADDFTAGFMKINAMVHHDGTIFWSPPARLRSSCKVDITFFPFDSQTCKLKFGSWSYDKAQVDLVNKTYIVDVSTYTTNGEWMLTDYFITRNEIVYPISDAIYPDVTVILIIQRRILYYVLNIIFPCFWLNILSVLTFCLPPDAGEKITLSITVLLSYSVFMLLVAESMPPTSEFVPLIGIYLTVSMAVASVSVILTVLVLKLHHCSPHQRAIPGWVRTIVLGYLARIARCSCVRPKRPKCIRVKKTRNSKTSTEVKEDPDAERKLMKDGDTFTHDSHHMFVPSLRDARHPNQSRGLVTANHIDNNNMFSDVREGGNLSNRSSFTEDESTAFSRNDNISSSLHGILRYLKIMLSKSDSQDAENDIVDEWKQVALVVDRMFFWLFLLMTILSTLIILVVVPSFHYSSKDGL